MARVDSNSWGSMSMACRSRVARSVRAGTCRRAGIGVIMEGVSKIRATDDVSAAIGPTAVTSRYRSPPILVKHPIVRAVSVNIDINRAKTMLVIDIFACRRTAISMSVIL